MANSFSSCRRRPRGLLFTLSALLVPAGLGLAVTGWSGVAQAGQPPVGAPQGGPQGPTAAGRDKKDGPAEEAPKDKQALQPIEPIPAQPPTRRRLQFFEAHGYIRMRADYFHRMDLGTTGVDGTPSTLDDIKFFRPPSETPNTGAPTTANCVARNSGNARAQSRCNNYNGFASANMRLRFEPTIHVSDNIKIHATVDALDNLVLGSTPDSFAYNNPWAPIDIFTRTQLPPASGINSFQDSITVKRAYGHMRFGWGLDVKFGRMPNQWGLGMVANDGNGIDRQLPDDLIRAVDTDYGDSIDSVRIGYDFGKDPRNFIHLSSSFDWAASGPTTSQVFGPEWASGGQVGQEFSVERFDNVYQWTLAVERRDSPEMLQRKLSLGVPVVNYGFKNWLRWQIIDRVIGAPGLGDGLGTNGRVEPDGLNHLGDPLGNGQLDAAGDTAFQNYANQLVYRNAVIATPDLWLRVNWRTLRVELEVAGNFGRFYSRALSDEESFNAEELEDQAANQVNVIANFGYALEFKYGLFDDRFHIGFDQGFAMGDPNPSLESNYISPFIQQNGLNEGTDTDAGNNIYETFRFNPAYQQDMLMFREVLGTVANAAYFKPWAAFYFFQGYASARADVNFAVVHQATGSVSSGLPIYGVELAGALRFHGVREPIFAQVQYGVLFPFAGLEYNGVDARAAQTVQGQVGIKF